MRLADLQQAIRDQLGAEGPQLPAVEYEARIDKLLEDMTVGQFLEMLTYMELE